MVKYRPKGAQTIRHRWEPIRSREQVRPSDAETQSNINAMSAHPDTNGWSFTPCRLFINKTTVLDYFRIVNDNN